MDERDSENDRTTPFLRDAPIDAAMFDHFKAARHIKAPKWAAPLFVGIAIFHIALFLVMWAKSIWEVETLDRPKDLAQIWIAPPPPPPPPPPKGSVKPQDLKIEVKKRQVNQIVQIARIEKPRVEQPNANPCPECPETGDHTGDGDPNGAVGAPPELAPPPPPPPPPQLQPPPTVTSQLLEGQRIAGEPQIAPDDVTKTEIHRSGKDKVVGSFKLCITAGGDISSITPLRTTGFSAYDAKIQREMRSWRYRPYEANGKAIPVCTAVTFIYSQH